MTALDIFLEERGRTRLVGRGHFTRERELSTTFMYDADYLVAGGVNIDPALQLTLGAQHQRGLLRAFADTAPDRWGRNILDKAERLRAREEGRVPRQLDDLSYLLGVSDGTRQGALRFREVGGETFLGAVAQVPPLIELPRLLRLSDDLSGDDEPTEAVKQLLDTGSTGLGGARPKASVTLDSGALGFAKFPHPSDEWDVMAWEATALDLLAVAGIAVPEHRLTRLGGRSILVLRRFDRTGEGFRVGYISAMTAIQARDGEPRDYADIALAIRDLALHPQWQHGELYDRAIASVVLGNTDDHLRNHGFLAEGAFWALSPAFDVNPNPDLSRRRATSIAGADTFEHEVEGMLALASDCGLTLDQARARFTRVSGALAAWREVARRNGIPESEITLMSDAIAPRLEAVTAAGG